MLRCKNIPAPLLRWIARPPIRAPGTQHVNLLWQLQRLLVRHHDALDRAGRASPGLAISSPKPPVPPVQHQRKRSCKCEHDREPERRIAREDSCEQRATCPTRHLHKAKQGCRDPALSPNGDRATALASGLAIPTRPRKQLRQGETAETSYSRRAQPAEARRLRWP